MNTRIGIRDLRNRTSEVIRLADRDGEVVITEHGRPVAVLRPYVAGWKLAAARLLDETDTSTDSGFAALLAADDEASTDDL